MGRGNLYIVETGDIWRSENGMFSFSGHLSLTDNFPRRKVELGHSICPPPSLGHTVFNLDASVNSGLIMAGESLAHDDV
jgi:hypothetical protein